MGKATIIEAQNSDTIYEESKSKSILGKLKGIFADYKHGTRNSDRLYTEELWDNRVFGSEDVMEALETKTLFGELDHPEGDRCETLAKNAAISITKLEKRPDEGVIYGEAEILDTPTGRIVKALADSGAKLGISSRGMGEEIFSEGRNIIDPDTYDFITFDVVVTPANTKARVSLVESKHLNTLTESLKKEIAVSETANQLNQMKTVLENINTSNKTDLINLVDEKLQKLNPEKQTKLSESNKQIALNLLKKKFEEQQAKLDKLSETTEFYKESRDNIKSKLKESTKVITDSKTAISEKDTTIENLQKEVESLKKTNALNDHNIRILKIKLEKRETANTSKVNALNEELNAKSAKIEELESANKQLLQNLNESSKILSDNKELIKQVESLKADKLNTNTKLQESKILSDNKVKQLEAKIAELQEKAKYSEDIESRYSKLPFSPTSTVTAIKENYDSSVQYTDDEIDLFNALTNK